MCAIKRERSTVSSTTVEVVNTDPLFHTTTVKSEQQKGDSRRRKYQLRQPKKESNVKTESAPFLTSRKLVCCSTHADSASADCHEAPAESLTHTTANNTNDVKSSISDEVEEEVAWYCRCCTMGNPATATACIMCDLRPPSSRKNRALKPPSTPCVTASANTTTTLSHNKMTRKVKIERRGGYISMPRRKRTIQKCRKVMDPKTPPVASEILIQCVICFQVYGDATLFPPLCVSIVCVSPYVCVGRPPPSIEQHHPLLLCIIIGLRRSTFIVDAPAIKNEFENFHCDLFESCVGFEHLC